jgi:hypothetical protein
MGRRMQDVISEKDSDSRSQIPDPSSQHANFEKAAATSSSQDMKRALYSKKVSLATHQFLQDQDRDPRAHNKVHKEKIKWW